MVANKQCRFHDLKVLCRSYASPTLRGRPRSCFLFYACACGMGRVTMTHAAAEDKMRAPSHSGHPMTWHWILDCFVFCQGLPFRQPRKIGNKYTFFIYLVHGQNGLRWPQVEPSRLQTLPTFWAERIWILRFFHLCVFLDSKFQDFQVPKFRIPQTSGFPTL